MTQHSNSGMKDLNEKSFESPQVLTAEILLSKFGQHYRDNLVPAINEGLDGLDEISWQTLHAYYGCPEDKRSMVALAEQLDCSIPDANYALDEAMQRLHQQVQWRARYNLSLPYLQKLLQFMYSAKALQPVALHTVQTPVKPTIREMLKGVLDLEAIRTLLGGALRENIAQVNFVHLSGDDPQVLGKEGRSAAEQNNVAVLPEGDDLPLEVTDRGSAARTWLRISAYGQVYLVYEGDVPYRGVQIGGGTSRLPWMFFDFRKSERTTGSVWYWVRLGYLDQQSKVVLESQATQAVLQEDLSQVSIQFLKH